MRRRLTRLRWQLTLSHLIAIVVTLVSMVAALILIAGSWIAVQTSPDREAANDARIVARSIGPLVGAAPGVSTRKYQPVRPFWTMALTTRGRCRTAASLKQG